MSASPVVIPSAAHDIRAEVITPDIARAYLESNTRNRPVSVARVSEYAAAMRSGKWVLNGDSLRFDASGRLIDGQHRLHACVQAGAPFCSYVIRGIDDARAFLTIDVGKVRGARDMLAYRSGDMTASMADKVAAAARLVYGWDACEDKARFRLAAPPKRTPEEWAEIAGGYMPRIEHIVATMPRNLERFAVRSVMVAAAFILDRINPEDAGRFMCSLAEGVCTDPDDPVKRLRDALLLRPISARDGQAANKREVMAIIFKSWNSFRDGKKVKVLRWVQHETRAESFPVPH